MKERNYFALTPDQIEIIQWAGAAPAALLNLAVRIDIDDMLDEALFRRALELSVERLSYARCRMHDMPDGTITQYISEPEEQVIPDWVDASGWSEKKLSKQLSQWTGTAFPNKQRDVQLFHAEILKTAGNKHCLYFCGHHVIMDIYAVVFFVNYLDKVYYALLTNTELPREGGSPEKASLARNAYLQSAKYWKDYDWFKNEFSTEPQFTSINGLGGKEYIRGKKYGHDRNLLQMAAKEKIFEIPGELENNVIQMCEERNISPSMVYCFSLRCYLSAVCDTNDVSLRVPFSLRATLDEKSSGLCRAGSFNFRIDLPSDITFADALEKVNFADRNYLKHAFLPNPNLQVKTFWGAPQDCNYHSVTFSYVPFVNFDNIHLKIQATKIDSGIAIGPVYILAMHLGPGQGLSMIYQYSAGYVKAENIDKCQAFLVRFLEIGLANPDMTIRELTDRCI